MYDTSAEFKTVRSIMKYRRQIIYTSMVLQDDA